MTAPAPPRLICFSKGGDLTPADQEQRLVTRCAVSMRFQFSFADLNVRRQRIWNASALLRIGEFRKPRTPHGAFAYRLGEISVESQKNGNGCCASIPRP